MTLKSEVTRILNQYSVQQDMVFWRRWSYEWTINDFAESLLEIMNINREKLTDDKLITLVCGMIKLLELYPQCQSFIDQLRPLIEDHSSADPETMLKITRRYREKFSLIPPIETSSALEMLYGGEQSIYMRLTMDMIDECADRLGAIKIDDLTYENFIAELKHLGEKRKEIAQACGHANKENFGVPRWEHPDDAQICTSLTASNYLDLGKLCLAGRQVDRDPTINSEQYFLTIDNKRIPTSRLTWRQDDRIVYLYHTLSKDLDAILHGAFIYWKKALQPNISKKELMEAIATIEYLLQHGMPFTRGSAAIVTAMNYGIYKVHGHEMIPTKRNTAIYYHALATRDLHQFIKIYPGIFATYPVALHAQPIKNEFTPQTLALAQIKRLRMTLSKVKINGTSNSTTPFYQSSTETELSKLKKRIDADNFFDDINLPDDIDSYCKNNHKPFAKELKNALSHTFVRSSAQDVLVLWETKSNTGLRHQENSRDQKSCVIS